MPVALFVALAVLIFAAAWVSRLNLPMPPCGMRMLTGLPCLVCGSTRLLAACAQLNFAEALRLNPLVFVACAGVVAWFGLWLVEHCRGEAKLSHLLPFAKRWPWLALLCAAALLNWVYLCLTLPR